VEGLRAFLASNLARKWMGDLKMAPTTILESLSISELPTAWHDKIPHGAVIVEHAPIFFRNYPYEWAPEMLRSAATLTLELASAAMRGGFALKDATPYNVMFDDRKPVFLDVLSFRPCDHLESIWQPYGQFVRTFVYPLIACRYFGLRLDEILLAHRDGLEPGRLMALCPPYRLLFPPFLSSVTIPFLLGRGSHNAASHRYHVRHARDVDEAIFILERTFAHAARLLGRASIGRRRAETREYSNSGNSYAASEFAEKERLLTAVFERWSPRIVLDVGCNTGHFSLLAGRSGARVVAIDNDPGVVDVLWQSAAKANLPILPLVVDIARPSGACGWQNSECAAFLDRARGAFDCVLMLALIHHLLVNERVPLTAILHLAAELTTHLAIVEYIDPADLLFRQITRGRDALHRNVTRESFETAACRWFQILDATDVSPTRRIYTLRKHGI
jgi:SAM-dependent methyltransferase